MTNSDIFGEKTGEPVANCESMLEFTIQGCSVDINLEVNLGKWDESMVKAECQHKEDDTLQRHPAVDPESFGKCLE